LETLALSRKLATIRVDLDLPAQAASHARRAPDTAKLRELYTRLEFRGLLRALDAASGGDGASQAADAGTAQAAARTSTAAAAATAPAPAAPPAALDNSAIAAIPRTYETILDTADLERWLDALGKAELTAFDTETTS